MIAGGLAMTGLGYGYDRPAGSMHGSRSEVVATNGMVCASQPLAAEVGLEVLKAGGNAIDAAIAVDAMLGLVEPMSCGIGGDLFVILWDAKSQRLYGLNASGRSPYAMNAQLLKQRGLGAIPGGGPLSWSVPGCVDGWDQLLKRFGRKSMAEVLAPAIHYAENGFAVSPIIGAGWQGMEGAIHEHPSMACYLVKGRAPKAGGVFKNPGLAQSYRLLAKGGRDAFYRGEIARRIVAYSEKAGGLFTMRDLEDHASTWVAPVSTTYRGYAVWEMPPNGQGIAVLQMLNILEGYDLKSLGHNLAPYLHLLIEAKKLAYADRARFYADPEMAEVPVAQLISKEYAKRRRARIDLQRAAQVVPPGDPYALSADETVYLTVVDKERNAVSLIQSNFGGWGSREVPDSLGFVLQNRGQSFSMNPDHPNFVRPHKRPFHTIIPGFVTKDGKPFFSFGVMGGDMQPQGHVQVLCDLIDFGMDVQEAGDAARVRHDGSPSPTGGEMTSGGSVAMESGIGAQVREALTAMGHKVVPDVGGFGGYQGILIDPDTGVLHGGTEARKDGCAAGY
jgi:gamma-glutamyltranspeptidase/glutathione hydrolase